jgi:hypothetical protein
MKRDGTGLKESGGEGIACGGGRSVVTRGVVTRGVVTRGVVTRGVVTRGVAWIHDLGVLQEEWLRGACFAAFVSRCLLRGVCFAGLIPRWLFPIVHYGDPTANFSEGIFKFACIKLCV